MFHNTFSDSKLVANFNQLWLSKEGRAHEDDFCGMTILLMIELSHSLYMGELWLFMTYSQPRENKLSQISNSYVKLYKKLSLGSESQ